MSYTRDNGDGTRAINRVETFVGALAGRNVLQLANFDSLMQFAEQLVRAEYPTVSQGALNNVRGDWYESLIALGAFQYALEKSSPYVLVNLPNINAFSCHNLYVNAISVLIEDLRSVLSASADVSLISSNPDFVMVAVKRLTLKGIAAGSVADIEYLSNVYLQLVHACEFADIIGYASVKSGLRPDRRLQIAHEGSLMKALYRHVQTRLWAINAPGVRYYGIAGSVTNADQQALKTVATHSIVDVSGKPESAVDQLFEVNSGSALRAALDIIIPKGPAN